MGSAEQNNLKELINSAPLESIYNYYCAPDPVTFEHNVWIFRTIIIINVFLVLFVILAYVLARHFGKCINLWELLGENLAIFLGVGVIEITFFYFVAMHYVPAPPSTLVNSVVSSIQNVF